jgi:predicted dehydrogenase
MGTACAPPVVANIYMAADFEASARQLADEWPRFYFRLIDDGFFIWEHGLAALSVFQQLLGSLRPNIHTYALHFSRTFIASHI